MHVRYYEFVPTPVISMSTGELNLRSKSFPFLIVLKYSRIIQNASKLKRLLLKYVTRNEMEIFYSK
jgi:hypothetical protein